MSIGLQHEPCSRIESEYPSTVLVCSPHALLVWWERYANSAGEPAGYGADPLGPLIEDAPAMFIITMPESVATRRPHTSRTASLRAWRRKPGRDVRTISTTRYSTFAVDVHAGSFRGTTDRDV